MLMSVYKEDADNLNLIDVANDFYGTGNSHRLSKFGHFPEIDYVEHLANHYIHNYCGHTGLYKFHGLYCHNNVVL